MNKLIDALGATHPVTLYHAGNHGEALSSCGHHAEATSLLARTREQLIGSLGNDHAYTLRTASVFGLAMLRAAHAAQLRVVGPEHTDAKRSASWLQGGCATIHTNKRSSSDLLGDVVVEVGGGLGQTASCPRRCKRSRSGAGHSAE